MTTPKRDLYVLAADADMLQAMQGLLDRPARLNVRPIDYKIERHLNRDAGCRTGAAAYLAPLRSSYQHAIVIFDKDGCGREDASREEIQKDVELALDRNGWGTKAKAIVIEPELEAWVWRESPHVANALGWTSYTELKTWLADRGHWSAGAAKPRDPKKAMRTALREKRRQSSAALFGELARKVSLRRCGCPAFTELLETLGAWFPRTAVRPSMWQQGAKDHRSV